MDPVRDWLLDWQVAWLVLSSTANKICPWEVAWEETIIGVFCWETPFDRYGCLSEGFWERTHLFDVVSQKLISYDFVLPLCCTKCRSRRSLGGSRWKLIELTHVSRFSAYVKLPVVTTFRVQCCKPFEHYSSFCCDKQGMSLPAWAYLQGRQRVCLYFYLRKCILMIIFEVHQGV